MPLITAFSLGETQDVVRYKENNLFILTNIMRDRISLPCTHLKTLQRKIKCSQCSSSFICDCQRKEKSITLRLNRDL